MPEPSATVCRFIFPIGKICRFRLAVADPEPHGIAWRPKPKLLTFASSEAQIAEECKELVPDWEDVPWRQDSFLPVESTAHMFFEASQREKNPSAHLSTCRHFTPAAPFTDFTFLSALSWGSVAAPSHARSFLPVVRSSLPCLAIVFTQCFQQRGSSLDEIHALNKPPKPDKGFCRN